MLEEGREGRGQAEEGHCRPARGTLMAQGEAGPSDDRKEQGAGPQGHSLPSVRRHLPLPGGRHW